jgi:hypothetical protein
MRTEIKLYNLVAGKVNGKQFIGTVVGMSRLDLSVGPVLHVRDLTTKGLIECLPMFVTKLVPAT